MSALIPDAPDGQTWRCPDCGSMATLSDNAMFHQANRRHRMPILVPFPKPDNAELDRWARTTIADIASAAGDVKSMTELKDRFAPLLVRRVLAGK